MRRAILLKRIANGSPHGAPQNRMSRGPGGKDFSRWAIFVNFRAKKIAVVILFEAHLERF